MARLRAQVTLQWTSALPQDVSINTFHFLTEGDPATPAELDAIEAELINFWTVSSGVAGAQLDGYLSNLVSRAALAHTIAIYDLADVEPRVPVRETQFTIGASDAANSLPTEVALCLSFQAAPISGVPQARRRGRVYVGPFNHIVVGNAGRPDPVLIASLAAAGNVLLDTFQGASPVRWTVYSRVGDAMAEVVDGWVDDEWDTMRSRGRLRTSRTTFS